VPPGRIQGEFAGLARGLLNVRRTCCARFNDEAIRMYLSVLPAAWPPATPARAGTSADVVINGKAPQFFVMFDGLRHAAGRMSGRCGEIGHAQ